VEDLCAHIEGIGTCSSLRGGKQLPNDMAGTLLVFKTYDAMSYALIMSAVKPIQVNDRVRNP